MALLTKPGNQPEEPPNLVLIGYRATGKTSVGEELARILKRPFVDLNRVLVAEAGQSVADLVAQSGWAEFRRREKELVARYRGDRGRVLATGGGVVLDAGKPGDAAGKWHHHLAHRRPGHHPGPGSAARTGPGRTPAPASPAATP